MSIDQTHQFIKKQFLFDEEYNFYLLLYRLFHEHFYIFTQVRLEDIVGSADHIPEHREFLKKHSVDFLIVLKTDRSQYLVVELNGITHRRPDRIHRDDELRSILSLAGVPFVIEQCSFNYSETAVLSALEPFLNKLKKEVE